MAGESGEIPGEPSIARLGRIWAEHFTFQLRLGRLAVAMVTFALYAQVFFALNHFMGPAVVTLALLPVVLAGWFLGHGGGR